MIDFKLNDMIPSYCKLEFCEGSKKYRLFHYPPKDTWKWSVEIRCEKEFIRTIAFESIDFESAEEAYEHMKEYINEMRS